MHFHIKGRKPISLIKLSRYSPFFLLFFALPLLLIACGEATATLPPPTATTPPTATSIPAPTATTTPIPTATPASTATAVPPSPTIAITPTSASVPPTIPATSDSAAIKASLQKAADAHTKLSSVHFRVEVKAGKAEVRGSDMQNAEGDVKSPDDFQASVKVSSLFGPIGVEVVGVGGEQFTTNPITGGWIKSNKESYIKVAALLDPRDGVSGVLTNLKDAKLIGAETLNGEAVMHYQGVSTGKVLSPITIYILGKNDATLDIWVGAKDNLVRQINLKEIGGDGVWVIAFSRFNEPVTINRPKT